MTNQLIVAALDKTFWKNNSKGVRPFQMHFLSSAHMDVIRM